MSTEPMESGSSSEKPPTSTNVATYSLIPPSYGDAPPAFSEIPSSEDSSSTSSSTTNTVSSSATSSKFFHVKFPCKKGAKNFLAHKIKQSALDLGNETLSHLAQPWDPIAFHKSQRQKSSRTAIIRIKKDIMDLLKDPPVGITIQPNEEDVSELYAIISGSFDTPYEGGFFLFYIKFPPQYPINPPLVRLLTTDGGKVRFNPNWYNNGKVCLSILGTWSGPKWSPAQTLTSVLISIQSLMNEKPYHNEPGYETERHRGDCEKYSQCIEHETLRVAVCGMLEGECSNMPVEFVGLLQGLFMENYGYYLKLCRDRMHLDGKKMMDPFGADRGTFQYKDLLDRVRKIHRDIEGDVNEPKST